MPPRPKYTSLDDSLYDYLVSHRSPDDAVVESVMLPVADGLTLARRLG